MKKKRLSYEEFFMKKNNQAHTNHIRFSVAKGNDRKFLGDNVISTTDNS